MRARWIAFGEIEIEGRRYTHDIVIDAGTVRKRAKKASKAYRDEYGHTPLSLEEGIPWGGGRLIVGTGESGSLPIMPKCLEGSRAARGRDSGGAHRGGSAFAARPRGQGCPRRRPRDVLTRRAARRSGLGAGQTLPRQGALVRPRIVGLGAQAPQHARRGPDRPSGGLAELTPSQRRGDGGRLPGTQ